MCILCGVDDCDCADNAPTAYPDCGSTSCPGGCKPDESTDSTDDDSDDAK